MAGDSVNELERGLSYGDSTGLRKHFQMQIFVSRKESSNALTNK